MSTYAQIAFNQFRKRGVLVDTNLMLLYIVGSYDLRIIEQSSFKRTSVYSPEDFGLVSRLISMFSRTVTTPHVLTEVSNLAAQLPDDQKLKCFEVFRATMVSFDEVQIPFSLASESEFFLHLGLADSGIARLASEFLVLTDDLRFAARLSRSGFHALNINHMRQAAWLADKRR